MEPRAAQSTNTSGITAQSTDVSFAYNNGSFTADERLNESEGSGDVPLKTRPTDLTSSTASWLQSDELPSGLNGVRRYFHQPTWWHIRPRRNIVGRLPARVLSGRYLKKVVKQWVPLAGVVAFCWGERVFFKEACSTARHYRYVVMQLVCLVHIPLGLLSGCLVAFVRVHRRRLPLHTERHATVQPTTGFPSPDRRADGEADFTDLASVNQVEGGSSDMVAVLHQPEPRDAATSRRVPLVAGGRARWRAAMHSVREFFREIAESAATSFPRPSANNLSGVSLFMWGLIDCIAAILFYVPAGIMPGWQTVTSLQVGIPIQLFINACLHQRKYRAVHYVGALLILLGIAINVVPWARAKTTTTCPSHWSSYLYILAGCLTVISGAWKEVALLHSPQPADPRCLHALISLIQLLWSFAFLPAGLYLQQHLHTGHHVHPPAPTPATTTPPPAPPGPSSPPNNNVIASIVSLRRALLGAGDEANTGDLMSPQLFYRDAFMCLVGGIDPPEPSPVTTAPAPPAPSPPPSPPSLSGGDVLQSMLSLKPGECRTARDFVGLLLLSHVLLYYSSTMAMQSMHGIVALGAVSSVGALAAFITFFVVRPLDPFDYLATLSSAAIILGVFLYRLHKDPALESTEGLEDDDGMDEEEDDETQARDSARPNPLRRLRSRALIDTAAARPIPHPLTQQQQQQPSDVTQAGGRQEGL